MPLLPLILGLLLPGTASPVGPVPRPAPCAELETLPFARVAQQPATFVGREIRIVFQFHSLEESWNPFLTRFSAADYVAVRGWSDEQLPWQRDEFERLPVRVFARRGGDGLERFFGLGQRHERIAVIGVVREVFAGQPWIEVFGAEVLPESIPEGSVLHAIRALDFEQKHAFGLALGELERANAAPLPERARQALLEIHDRCVSAQSKK